MHYKTKSLVTILTVVAIMIGLAFTLGSFRNSSITGATTADECPLVCRADIDCYDGDKCTEDVCVNPYDCSSYCENIPKPGCS